MAHPASITDNVLNLAKNAQLRFRLVRFATGVTDIIAHLTHEGATYEGRGTSFSEDIAVAKAAAEALERCYLITNNVDSSNGWALRESAELAAQGARREAIERDAFAAHLIASVPFYKTQAPADKRINDFIAELSREHVSFQFCELQRSTEIRVVVAIANQLKAPHGWGVIVGLGSSEDLEAAIEQSFFECARNVVAANYDVNAFTGPRKLALERDYATKFLKAFEPTEPAKATQENLSVATEVFELEFPNTSGLWLAHAHFDNQFTLKNLKVENEQQRRRLQKIFGDKIKEPFQLGQPLG